MTASPPVTTTVTTASSSSEDGDGLAGVRRVAAGASLALGTVLYGVGAALSPDQADHSSRGYVSSLAEDPLQSDLSAAFLHWGWVLLVPGLLVALTLVRGRRGRWLTAVGGTVGVLGAINISGLVMSDFFNARGVAAVGLDDTVAVMEAAMASPGLSLWVLVGRIGAGLAIPVMLLGLARAGVIGWWAAPLFLAGGIGPYVVPGLWAVPVVVLTSLPGLVLGLTIARRPTASAVPSVPAPRTPALV
jgi:hypothetical protein